VLISSHLLAELAQLIDDVVVAQGRVVRESPLAALSGDDGARLRYAGWLIFIEGLIGKLEQPLPFSAFLAAATGDSRHLLILARWTAAAMIAATVAIRRDLTAD
jgi:hypothetical protein